MDIAKPGTYNLKVRGFTGTINITSEVTVFYIVIQTDLRAQILFSLSTTATSFKAGTTIEVRVEILNNGTVNFNRLMIRFYQSQGPYAIRTNEQKIYNQIIAPGDIVSYVLSIYIYQDTKVLNFLVDLMAENYHTQLALKLDTTTPEGTSMTAIITYSVAGAGVAGAAVATVKVVRGMKLKKEKKLTATQPKVGEDQDHGSNKDVEFKF